MRYNNTKDQMKCQIVAKRFTSNRKKSKEKKKKRKKENAAKPDRYYLKKLICINYYRKNDESDYQKTLK